MDEFYDHPVTVAILYQFSTKQFHRLDGLDKPWTMKLGLNHANTQCLQDVRPDNEEAQ